MMCEPLTCCEKCHFSDVDAGSSGKAVHRLRDAKVVSVSKLPYVVLAATLLFVQHTHCVLSNLHNAGSCTFMR